MLKKILPLSFSILIIAVFFACSGNDSSKSKGTIPGRGGAPGYSGKAVDAGQKGFKGVSSSRDSSSNSQMRKAERGRSNKLPESGKKRLTNKSPTGGRGGMDRQRSPIRPGMKTGLSSKETVAMPVEVATVIRRDVREFILASTTLEALREVEVFSKTSGLVTSLLVEEGDRVDAGDTLLVIDDREALLNMKKAEIAYREAKNSLDRNKQMRSRNLVSEEEYETAQLAYERAKTELDAAKLSFDYTRVTAPIGGRIVERFVELGDMVTQGKALFRMARFNPLRARVYVPEKDLRKLKVGQDAILEVESEPGKEFHGKVELISSVVDPNSGTFKVTLKVDSSSGLLRPGMFASVKIVVSRHPNALVVPREAILYEGDLRYIYVVREGAAERVDVQTGFSDGGFIEVSGDISEGEGVVVAGQNNLASGMKVEVVKTVGQSDSTGI